LFVEFRRSKYVFHEKKDPNDHGEGMRRYDHEERRMKGIGEKSQNRVQRVRHGEKADRTKIRG
jgi:hypothetical protein